MITLKNPPLVEKPQPDPTDAQAWIQAKIDEYQAEVERLEAQLKHTRILLRGHQTWLDDIERKAGRR